FCRNYHSFLFEKKHHQEKNTSFIRRFRGRYFFLAHVRFDMASAFSLTLFTVLAMEKSLSITYYILLVITLLVAGVFYFQGTKLILILTIALSLLKFYLVGFRFMELRFAHTFWKVLIVVYGLLIGGIWMFLL